MLHVIIEMSLPVYDGFIDKCDQSSREYAILKNGLIIRRPKGDHFERIVEIACDMDDADKLFLLASKVYPEALEDIIKSYRAREIGLAPSTCETAGSGCMR